MKKSSKPLIVLIASLLVLITIIILVAQGLQLKYEELQRELTQLENQMKTEKTQSVGLKANYQMLTAEDIIKKFAMNELGLVDASFDPNNKITLSTEEITELSESMENLHD
jgi:cell division protein FtsB